MTNQPISREDVARAVLEIREWMDEEPMSKPPFAKIIALLDAADRLAAPTEAGEASERDFGGWSTADLSAQCRSQAREQLDPEFTAFMSAVADRLSGRREIEAALAAQTDVVDRLCSAIERAEHDIGGESVNDVLALLGPANDTARAALKGKPTSKPNVAADAEAGHPDAIALRELALLYNHAQDDSCQFTRWQMVTAVAHGRCLARQEAGVEAETYRQMHEIATKDLGYPSILEALEAAPSAALGGTSHE